MSKTNSANEITWTTDDLGIDRINGILGASFVARLLAEHNAAAFCSGRAYGAWQANEREYHAAYRSLAKIAAA